MRLYESGDRLFPDALGAPSFCLLFLLTIWGIVVDMEDIASADLRPLLLAIVGVSASIYWIDELALEAERRRRARRKS